MKDKEQITCVYCNASPPETVDHIPPKCLFEKPRPSNLVTIPCCEKCNKQAALDDEYFRTTMAFRWDVYEHPAAQKIIESSLRAVSRDQASGLSKLFTQTLEAINLYSHSGLYIGKGGRFKVDSIRIERVLIRIVRGLFYYKTGRRLSEDTNVVVISDEITEQANPKLRREIICGLAPIFNKEPEVFGKETFLFYWNQQNTEMTYWVLVFFSKIIYYAVTVPSDMYKESQKEILFDM
jgi:hypothetical protein